ncbi:tyrosine-type recombinase/integrase [Corynebacterium sphenisci]|uniref:tyrosine-type recombinase/integrase n=1 Tax=Corynebacterium sphenisci TaxID=191493 RepID=UPI0012F482EB|nr:tyrosine-type recombinase/integrase [Corynebacterium sphenisci]
MSRTRASRAAAGIAWRQAAVEEAARTRYGDTAGGDAAGLTDASTVVELVGAWLDSREGDLSPASRRIYRAALDHQIAPYLGDLVLREVGPRAVQAAADRMTPQSWRRARVVLRGAWQWGLRMEVVAHDPITPTTPPRVPARDPQALTPGEVRDTIAAVAARTNDPDIPGPRPRHPWLGALCVVLLGTGLRVSEATAMRWGDLDLDDDAAPSLLVRPVKTRHGTLARRRRVVLPRYAAATLREWRPAGADPAAPVWATSAGTAVAPGAVHRAMRAVAAYAAQRGLPYPDPAPTPHAFRRTVATAVAGDDLRAAAAQLGHAKISTTEAHYAERLVEVDVAAALDEYFAT